MRPRLLYVLLLECGLLGFAGAKFQLKSHSPKRQAIRQRLQRIVRQLALTFDCRWSLAPVRFAVIGDTNGRARAIRGRTKLHQAYHKVVKFDFVIMLGDKIYGRHRAPDFHRKFQVPCKALPGRKE